MEESRILSTTLIISDEFKANIKAFKKDFADKYRRISKERTPEVDGTGKKIIDKRPDGYDFIIEAYMRNCLDGHFPGWSWEMGGPPQFLGSEWVIGWGTLTIIDEHLLAFGLNPPIRKFSAASGVRIKFGRNKPHTPDNVVDIGNDVSALNSKAFKKAINQLTHIGDDVYGKRIEEENMGTLEEIVASDSVTMDENVAATAFSKLVKDMRMSWTKVFEILGVKDLTEIKDYKQALSKLKEIQEKGG